MLSASKTSIPETLLVLKQFNISASFLVPTATGIDKSIMDAHSSVRDWLSQNELHDFDHQRQGQENKRLIPTIIISDQTVETETSLYRPNTKSGDPRIWPKGLKKLCDENDLLVLICFQRQLIVINATRCEVTTSLFQTHRILRALIASLEGPKLDGENIADELLQKLREVGRRGWIRTMRSGDTGIGYTLETLLGIQANSNKAPDYKGIELKSHRRGASSGRQVALFSQVPDWAVSRLKGKSKALLYERGRFSEEKQRLQLFHEISCLKPNSYGMQLALIDAETNLLQFHVNSEDGRVTNDVQWAVDTLHTRMKEKHRETMWVSASTRGKGKEEHFNYEEVTHTSGYDQNALTLLLDSGAMTVHYTITQKSNGSAKDQGYLFKLSPKYLPALFESQKTFAI